MKADPAVQRTLLDLAEVDAELARIAHKRSHLPEHAEIAELERTEQVRRDAVVAAETAAGDLDSDIAKQEKEIESVRSREERDKKLLDSGLGGKQQVDVEHELETLQRRQSELEDVQLEQMEQREALTADVERTKAELTQSQQAMSDAVGHRDEALADLETQQARREADQEKLRPQIPENLLADYTRIKQRTGTGAGLLRARKCGACHMELDRIAISTIAATPADEVVHCEECGAILVRTPESGV